MARAGCNAVGDASSLGRLNLSPLMPILADRPHAQHPLTMRIDRCAGT